MLALKRSSSKSSMDVEVQIRFLGVPRTASVSPWESLFAVPALGTPWLNK